MGKEKAKSKRIEKSKRTSKTAETNVVIQKVSSKGKKIDKRLMKKAIFHEKLAQLESQSSASGKKSGTFNVLSLSNALGDSSSTSTSKSKKGSQSLDNRPVKRNKAKRAVFAKEMEQMSAVLQHNAFKSNPIGTIREHLNNTVQKSNI